MRIFKPKEGEPDPNWCVVWDRIHNDGAPQPTLMEYLVGPDLFPHAPKHTPEETFAAVKRLAGRFIPTLRRDASDTNIPPQQ